MDCINFKQPRSILPSGVFELMVIFVANLSVNHLGEVNIFLLLVEI